MPLSFANAVSLRKRLLTRPAKECCSFADFFRDTPWLDVPVDRHAMFIAPLHPRGGLLGGSSDGAPKMSKLQALAAARKKKAQEGKSSGDTGVEKPMARLTINEDAKMGDTSTDQKSSSRGFPLRKRKDTNEHEKAPKAPPVQKELEPAPPSAPEEPPQQAEPSAFANTMFSNTSHTPRQPSEDLFTLPYTASSSSAASNPFSGPSPDDIVIAAQSKGPNISNSRPAKKEN